MSFRADNSTIIMEKEVKLSQLNGLLSGCFVLTDENVFGLYKEFLPKNAFVLPAGEGSKSFLFAERIIGEMLLRKMTRGGILAAVGGGVIGDLGGFAASFFMRGIDWVFVPTTVTALTDSSVGGKTAINCGGKNTVGSFHLPKAVYRCYDFLKTLPQTEFRDGMTEVYKTALLDRPLFEILSSNAAAALEPYGKEAEAFYKRAFERAIAVKEKIVAEDFLDRAGRRRLNMGHTIGHALESLYGLSHGKSVAIGLFAEAEMCGVTDNSTMNFIKKAALPHLSGFSLNGKDVNSAAERITNAAIIDKKNSGEKTEITLIVPKTIEESVEVKLAPAVFEKKVREFLSANY